MLRNIEDFMKRLIVPIIVQVVVLLILQFAIKVNTLPGWIILVVEVVLLYLTSDHYMNIAEDHYMEVEKILSSSTSEAFQFGQLGIVIYDDDHVITEMSDLFRSRNINRIGSKILAWLPEVDDLVNGLTDLATVKLDERTYEITKKQDAPVLFFKDVTDTTEYQMAYEEGKTVIGMANFDNYEESTQYEDESYVSAINVAIRTPLTDYCKDHGIMAKRLNNYRYLLILNEKIFNDLADDHFSILNTVRKAAQKQDASITLSMAFARGTDNFEELDEMVSRLMDLAQNRGGDQVAVQVAGEDVKHFGGSSEATEKRSRVRVRVMAHTLRELLDRSSNVIICGHKEADFDCIGSAIAMAEATKALNKPVSIIAKTGGIEEKLSVVLEEHKEELEESINFVSESEALNQLQDETLVVMVDHHNLKQSNGAKVLEQAKNVAIIDHHRRSSEMGVQPVFVYIEAGASSACELMTELIPYISNRTEISELEANIMLAGMTIDTDHFRVRTGSRTFEAAGSLRSMGADPLVVDEYLKDNFEEFSLKSAVMNASERYNHGIIIAPVKDLTLTRSMMSQIADSLLDIQNVEASFVIANNTEGETAISARSNGNINVQILMEQMNGGGHLTAAAMQRSKSDIDEVKQELINHIDEYFQEVKQDESDIKE